jgi:GNAT superfamily N-acetyltransferase
MIRQATKYDASEIISMMKKFRLESPMPELLDVEDEEYWRKMLNDIFAGKGKVFIEEGKGLLICMIMPSIWSPQILLLHELAWYVLPEHRKTTTGYRLIKAYLNYAEQLVSSGRIRYYTLNKMVTSPNLKYEKLGFRKIDEIWIQ